MRSSKLLGYFSKLEPIELKKLRELYDKVQKGLISIEEDCDKFWVEMKLDLLLENKIRSEPLLDELPIKIRTAYEACKNALLENDENILSLERCYYTWKNVSESILNDEKIRSENLDLLPTKFDETDLKFKQDLMELRTKVFSLVNDKIDMICPRTEVENTVSSTSKSYYQIVKKYKRSSASLGKIDLSHIHALKYVDGELTKNEGWSNVLDISGKQLRSKWYLVVSPQIEKMLRNRRIYSLRLDPLKVYNFLLSIPESGIHFKLSKENVLFLLQDISEEGPWITSWKPQLKTFDKKKIAAILIQSCWRGYWLRKQLNESYRRYIAASVLWYKWLSIKYKREMYAIHLKKMLLSLNISRVFSKKLSKEFYDLIKYPHVIIHVPSIGYSMNIRQTFPPKILGTYQHSMIWRLSFLRNQMSEFVYILPIEVTQDLLSMYVDIIDSIISQERTANRVTFLPLSQAKTLKLTHMNVSKILHCSESTLTAIKKKINGKLAYILPWVVDEYDLRLSDYLCIPLLGPDMMLQRELLNLSKISELIKNLGIPQPAYSKDIRDYTKLCANLAELILLNTDICLWLIRLNVGVQSKHYGVFLINHISIPFMPAIRQIRQQYGDEWISNSRVREEYLNILLIHLPKIVSIVTSFNKLYYNSWKDFYNHVQKFGCLLQAVPNQKSSNSISVALFIPDKITGKPIKWIGTSDKLRLDFNVSLYAFMIPQTSVNTEILNPNVNKLAYTLQEMGYFGYLTIDCYCYFDDNKDKMIVLILDIHPYYSHLQMYIDWMKFVIDGSYNSTTNTFNGNVFIPKYSRKKGIITSIYDKNWNETTERTAIVICELYHVNLPTYSWPKLKILMEDLGIVYEATKKIGFNFFLRDSEIRNSGTMVIVTPNMKMTLLKTCSILRKFYHALSTKKKSESNMLNIANFFEKLSLNYYDQSHDPCKVTAQLVTHPTDVVKLRMQMTNNTFINTIREILKMKDPRRFYDGLSAALLRQITYTMTKLGMYTTTLEYWTNHFGRPSYGGMISIGMFSGVVGAFVGIPADVVLVRMVGDVKLPPEQRRNYKNVLTALVDITKKEGIIALWRGTIPTLGRAAIVNGVQLGTYSRAKYALLDTGYFVDNLGTQFLAANISGFVATLTSLPLDLAKTKIQNWMGPSKPPGMIQVMIKTTKKNGLFSLWRGFLAYYTKAGPTTIITMLCVDQLQALYLRTFT
ncbi:IQ domain-containing protein H-like isoform X1 [Vespula squamosa]|uniref:IQ domain-containing protein H-like isoform X1 n=1 Tax=Vespula squamosa TaxID=30214 RepID=A0ABD2A315_VESSQ